MADDFQTFTDHKGRQIRLTNERWEHILSHSEMVNQQERIIETLTQPELIVATVKDESVHVYHRFYEQTPVTSKYLLVSVKILPEDAFILTAFFSNRVKKGNVLWQP